MRDWVGYCLHRFTDCAPSLQMYMASLTNPMKMLRNTSKKVPCANRDKTYVWKPGRKLGIRLRWHMAEFMNQRPSKHSQNSAHCQLGRDQQNHCNQPRNPAEYHDQLVPCHSQWWTESQTVFPGWSRWPFRIHPRGRCTIDDTVR